MLVVYGRENDRDREDGNPETDERDLGEETFGMPPLALGLDRRQCPPMVAIQRGAAGEGKNRQGEQKYDREILHCPKAREYSQKRDGRRIYVAPHQ